MLKFVAAGGPRVISSPAAGAPPPPAPARPRRFKHISGGARMMKMILTLAALALSVPALGADSSVPLLAVTPGAGEQVIGVPGASLAWLLLFPFLPALRLGFTAFTRLAVVLFLLRQGPGRQTP